MTSIGGAKPLVINGKSKFQTLDEAKTAAKQHSGSEAIRQREDGQFEVVAINTTSEFNSEVASAHQRSKDFQTQVSFVDLQSGQKPEIAQSDGVVALSIADPSSGVAEDITVNFGFQLSENRLGEAANAFQKTNQEMIEKEFRFAPEGSDKWKLFKAMELLSKLELDSNSITDPEAREVLNMRKAQIQDLLTQLNQKPEIKAAFARIKTAALKASGMTQTELMQQGNYILSQSFKNTLKGLSPADQQALLQKELSKIRFFNPDYAALVAAELSAQTMIENGQEQLNGLGPEQKAKVRKNVEYLIDDLTKNANSTAGNAFKPLRELQKLLKTLKGDQLAKLKDAIARSAVPIESEDASALKKALDELEGSKKWHGELGKILSSVAAVGTLISLERSYEDLSNKGLTLKTSVDLVKNTISLVGASKDIAGTGGLVLQKLGAKSWGEGLSKYGDDVLAKMGMVRWAGPVAGVIAAGNDFVDMYNEIQNEDTAGAWLKGVSAGAGLVAAGAGVVTAAGSAGAAWATGTTIASLAGPVGLAAVAIAAGAAIIYSFVAESEETGQFRKDLRALGLIDQEETLEEAFQTASEVKDSQGHTTHSAQAGFAWAKDKTVEEKGQLINALLDQATDEYEEDVIHLLLKDAMGKNPDAQGVDDFERLIVRTDQRRLAKELDDDQVGDILEALKKCNTPEAKQALEAFVTGLCDGHRLDLLQNADGSPKDFLKDLSPATLKDIALTVMKGYTDGAEEKFIARLIVDQSPERLGEILSRGGPDLVTELVKELPQAESQKLLQRFGEIAQALKQAESELQAQPNSESLKHKVEHLQHALDVPLNNFMRAVSEQSNGWFSNYEAVINRALTPEITQHLSPETLSHVSRKLMHATWPSKQASDALVKLLKQASPEQFQKVMEGSTPAFIRKVIGDSLNPEQAREMLTTFLQGKTQPDQNFQTLALGLVEKGHEDLIKAFIQEKGLDLQNTPVLKVIASDKTEATLENLVRDREKIAALSNEEKAIIVKYLMDGWTTDASETLIRDILVDTHGQDKAKFKELVSMIDAYKLANELGDPILSGKGDKESLEIFELLAKDGDPQDFIKYANRLGVDDNVRILFNFTSKPENRQYLSKLPAPVLKEMCEHLMDDYTGDDAEKAITNLIRYASDQAFVEVLKDKDFSSWLTKELETNEQWFTVLEDGVDQIKTITQRLGRMANDIEAIQAKKARGQALSPAEQSKLASRDKVAAALDSFALAVASEDYTQVLQNLATSPDTRGSIKMISPPVLKAMIDSIMAGLTWEQAEDTISDLLDKTSPQQLRELLGKNVGGQKFVENLVSEMDADHLRKLMEKMIGDGSVDVGMGFSYLASELAKDHHGETIRDLISKNSSVVNKIHPTVLQQMVVSLSKGWTSNESREAIAGILTNANPERLERLMQSNTDNPKHVSDWMVYTLTDAELTEVVKNFAKGNGSGQGLDAFLGSLALKKPGVLENLGQETLKKFSAEALKSAAAHCIKEYNDSVVYSSAKPALYELMNAAAAKSDQALKTVLDGIDMKKAGKMLGADQSHFDTLLKRVTQAGSDQQFKDFIQDVSNSTLLSAWPSVKTAKIPMSPAEREALFKRVVDEGNYTYAMDLLKGVSGTSGMESLLGKSSSSGMLSYLAEHIDEFGKSDMVEAGKLLLAHGNSRQIDAAFKKINSSSWFGNGAEVVKAVLGAIKTDTEKQAIYGKMPKSTLESLVGTLDSNWYKTIGQITGSYGDNLDLLQEIAKLASTEGKKTIVMGLVNSWWTPERAEQTIYNIFKEIPYERDQFYDLVQSMSTDELKKVMANLETEEQAGSVAAWVGEAEIRKFGETRYNFEVAAGALAYDHRQDAVDKMIDVLKNQYKTYDKVQPKHIGQMVNHLMNGDTNTYEEDTIYKLLDNSSWEQFRKIFKDGHVKADDVLSELTGYQDSNLRKWFSQEGIAY